MVNKIEKKNVKTDLKQPDQFHEYSMSFIEYLTHHKKYFYLGLVTIVAVFIIAGGFFYHRSNKEKAAGELYAAALNSYVISENSEEGQKRYEKALELYADLINNFKGTDSGTLALYNMGNIYSDLREHDKAIGSYEKFLADSSKDEPLNPLVLAGIGSCYEEKKNYDSALEYFRKSSDLLNDGGLKSLNLANMARIYEKMNDLEKAREYYKKTLDMTTDPFTEAITKRKLSALQ